LAVAILPMLGVGGLQLFKAEMPGPIKDSKLTPRLAETAKALWYIYVGLIVLCALSYWGAGLPLFDAIGESFSTVSTGGYTMYDSGFARYDSPLVELIAVVFMFLGAANFTLHYLAISGGGLATYWRNVEFRTYLYTLLTGVVITTGFFVFSWCVSALRGAFFAKFIYGGVAGDDDRFCFG